jgi:hypothetical protein
MPSPKALADRLGRASGWALLPASHNGGPHCLPPGKPEHDRGWHTTFAQAAPGILPFAGPAAIE